MSTDYSVAKREEAQDYMAEYPGFGELRSFGGAVDAEWRAVPLAATVEALRARFVCPRSDS